MKQEWLEKYLDSVDLVGKNTDILVGFNANIDVVHHSDDDGLDLSGSRPALKDSIESMDDLRSSLLYCIEHGENHEIDTQIDIDLEGEESIGGQAGIMSRYLAKTDNGVIFYTPMLSQELADLLPETVLYPVIEKDFALKNIRDSANTDRTKRNHIFEFNAEKTGRLILSDHLKGFGPYFRKGVEDNLESIDQNVDCVIVSGFHDATGNIQAKLKKSASQLEKISKPTHLEFVHKNREISTLVLKHVVPQVDSIGLDETEMKELVGLLGLDDRPEDLNLGKAFEYSKKILERFGLSRIHLHTYHYHLCVTREDYHVEPERIRESMLFGELSAIQVGDSGEIPGTEDIEGFDMENKQLQSLEELENFSEFFGLEKFAEEGTAEIDGFQVVSIPTIIHNDPEKTVGMGDIISAGSFASEFKSSG